MFQCRFCGSELTHIFCDLGHQPPSNSLLTKEQLDEPEVYYPLKVFWCEKCWLVQIPEIKKASEIFNEEYPYFSSQSPSNVSHAKEFCEIMMERFNPKTVLEIGSNDGYMLQFFKKKGCGVIGYDPARGPAEEARKKGIDTVADFFDMVDTMYLIGSVDLICGINVIAHQPDINDFVGAIKRALAPEGVAVFEFPHLMKLVEGCQYDTIYHEHYNYFSFNVIYKIFDAHGLTVFDVEEIPEHGGSLRIYAGHKKNELEMTDRAMWIGLAEGKVQKDVGFYQNFQKKVDKLKDEIKAVLFNCRGYGMICAYGAAAKGATLLNSCRIGTDIIQFVVDRSPHKRGKFMPGSHIPIVGEECIKQYRPAYVLVLPWNLKDEIMDQLSYIREWDGKFIIPIPEVQVL